MTLVCVARKNMIAHSLPAAMGYLCFAIASESVSSSEHAPPNSRNNLGADQNRFRFRHPASGDRPQHGNP